MPRERRRSGEIKKSDIQSSDNNISKSDSSSESKQPQQSENVFTERKRSTRRNKDVNEEKYKSEEEHYLTKNQILNRVEEIIKAERGMKFFIRTKGWAHLSEHIIHAADVSKYLEIFKEGISNDNYVDPAKEGAKTARIVNIVKF